jgi:hypothetical protein
MDLLDPFRPVVNAQDAANRSLVDFGTECQRDLLGNGRLRGPACIEDNDYRTPRGLDRAVMRSLTQHSPWVEAPVNLLMWGRPESAKPG